MSRYRGGAWAIVVMLACFTGVMSPAVAAEEAEMGPMDRWDSQANPASPVNASRHAMEPRDEELGVEVEIRDCWDSPEFEQRFNLAFEIDDEY